MAKTHSNLEISGQHLLQSIEIDFGRNSHHIQSTSDFNHDSSIVDDVDQYCNSKCNKTIPVISPTFPKRIDTL